MARLPVQRDLHKLLCQWALGLQASVLVSAVQGIGRQRELPGCVGVSGHGRVLAVPKLNNARRALLYYAGRLAGAGCRWLGFGEFNASADSAVGPR